MGGTVLKQRENHLVQIKTAHSGPSQASEVFPLPSPLSTGRLEKGEEKCHPKEKIS